MLSGLTKYRLQIAKRFLIPYNEKLYACDMDSLDVNAMGRFFPHASIDEIILNAKESENVSYNAQFVYPEGGAIEFVNALLKEVDSDKIKLSEHVTSIDIENKVVHTNLSNTYQYDNIISTVPFPKLLKMTGMDYDPSIYRYNKVLVYNIGFDLPSAISEHWIYFP